MGHERIYVAMRGAAYIGFARVLPRCASPRCALKRSHAGVALEPLALQARDAVVRFPCHCHECQTRRHRATQTALDGEKAREAIAVVNHA